MTIPQLPPSAEVEYYKKISKIESSDNPNAKAKTSSASGRFQFIKSTWIGLGYRWADVFNDKLQYEAIEKFTAQNARGLIEAGCAVNHATLYGSHFLGLSGFLRIMRAIPSTPIERVTEANQRKANPSILDGSVADFTDWLERKTGEDYTKRYSVSEPTPPPEAIIVHEPEYITPTRGGGGIIAFSIFALVIAAVVAFFIINRS